MAQSPRVRAEPEYSSAVVSFTWTTMPTHTAAAEKLKHAAVWQAVQVAAHQAGHVRSAPCRDNRNRNIRSAESNGS